MDTKSTDAEIKQQPSQQHPGDMADHMAVPSHSTVGPRHADCGFVLVSVPTSLIVQSGSPRPLFLARLRLRPSRFGVPQV